MTSIYMLRILVLQDNVANPFSFSLLQIFVCKKNSWNVHAHTKLWVRHSPKRRTLWRVKHFVEYSVMARGVRIKFFNCTKWKGLNGLTTKYWLGSFEHLIGGAPETSCERVIYFISVRMHHGICCLFFNPFTVKR